MMVVTIMLSQRGGQGRLWWRSSYDVLTLEISPSLHTLECLAGCCGAAEGVVVRAMLVWVLSFVFAGSASCYCLS